MSGADEQQRYKLLVRTHLETIRNLCWKAADGDTVLCAELVQAVFIDLWESMSLFDPSYSPRQQHQWVKHRCRGVFSHLFRRSSKPFFPLDDNLLVPSEENNLRETIDELSEGLSPRERAVLDLILQGYKTSEIAHRLGIKARSVSQTRQRIIQRMKNNYRRLYL